MINAFIFLNPQNTRIIGAPLMKNTRTHIIKLPLEVAEAFYILPGPLKTSLEE
jgi:hypothetical protein